MPSTARSKSPELYEAAALNRGSPYNSTATMCPRATGESSYPLSSLNRVSGALSASPTTIAPCEYPRSTVRMAGHCVLCALSTAMSRLTPAASLPDSHDAG